ncbi:nose resistant to fluoxetine protein 6-like [Adelges cooleyi]|uniref:nose resistant to fluoxetine protein 6-like n=1 Tax=Adelges cooleyi TaxID=133065 RepID=UPI00217FE9EE|nr:nose resistant to fluoxetine protein 6-like [Adelges cooleyi]XP_050436423.1 nose resistant to fluoxetine protein 6-like [Adelges cooleyi]XP_050436424.1 nose resistant to fluoxetine protein 6-like [Adelges cooleyi]XP_050436425.1 nose resistant to fluoxetine protein 6-like [Adelges cooleyi]
MKALMILLFAVYFQTIPYSSQLSSAIPENVNACAQPSKQSEERHMSEKEPTLYGIENSDNGTIWIGNMFAMLMNTFTPFSNESPKCTEDGKLYKEGLVKQELWAIQMYDSSAKYPSGLLSGIKYELGLYDQCMKAYSEKLNIHGTYVLPNIQFRLPAGNYNASDVWDKLKIDEDSKLPQTDNIYWALCVPDSCSRQDIQTSVQTLLEPTFQRYNISVNVFVDPLLYTPNRVSKSGKYADGYLIAFSIIVLLIIATVLAGTLYEMNIIDNQYVNRKNNEIIKTILHSFSIRTSLNDLLEEPKNHNNNVTFIDGIKTIGTFLVVATHRRLGNLMTPTVNPEHVESVLTNKRLISSTLALETFFVFAGFFFYRTINNRMKNNKQLNIFYSVFNRVFRLLPAYIMVIWFVKSVLPYLGDGPFWNQLMDREVQYCRKNWWTNILFINTYVNNHETCLSHSWYVPVEVHLFIVGEIITYIIWKRRKLGYWIYAIVFAMSIYLPSRTIYNNKTWGLLSIYPSELLSRRTSPFYTEVYIKSHQRSTTYLIGIAAAHVYTKMKNNGVQISVTHRKFGSFFSAIIMYLCHLIPSYFYLPGVEYNPWHHVLFYSLARIVFSLCVSYVMIINLDSQVKFLESRFLTFFGHFNYSMYFCHLIFIIQSVASNKTLSPINSWTTIRNILSDYMISFLVSIPIVLLWEMPCLRLRKQLEDYVKRDKNENAASTSVSTREKDKTN